ncbi:cyclophilin-like fold protein [Thiomicrospira sp. S5]|uniref:cyclophilin-like fold protein n=1 Tax=Thiomicrospira sp. S5 TaxID=1803865 RepID=UPI0019819C55|nr:cyclophilin-like fold protein [Thiomicrospira sp. S5]
MTRLLKKGLWGLLALMTHAAFAQNEATSMERESFMKIRLVMENAVVEASLDDNAASRDFAAMLPLDVTLSDYHQTEKIADLPSTLSTDGAPDGIDPAIGDITYYAPWGNLAIFYRDFGYARGLVRLGRIDSGIETLIKQGELRVRIERVQDGPD